MTTRAVPLLAFPSDAELELPGSKSEVNRLLVLAALSASEVLVHNAPPAEDVQHLVDGLATLGFDAALDPKRKIARIGPRRANAPTSGELFCGNAGTAMRFLTSVAAVTPGTWLIKGDERMRARPIKPLVEAWRQLDVEIEDQGGDVRVLGGQPSGGDVRVDGGVSSQFISSLLLVGAVLPKGLRVNVAGPLASRGYAQLTTTLARQFGIEATITGQQAHVSSGYGVVPQEVHAAADWSAMGAWTCLNHLYDARIRGANLHRRSGQPDEQLELTLETLSGDGDRIIDVDAIPDQFLNLACVAALRSGTTQITGARNLRVKECDRVAVMARELQKCGADIVEHDDGVTIRGGAPLRGVTIDPDGDHRVAMAFAMLGSLIRGFAIKDADCVAKSYPHFWEDLERLGRHPRPISIVGMRGAGKSTLGRALAEKLRASYIDADEAFEARHGAITAYVEMYGWPAFRREESRILADALGKCDVLATGGGAIESEALRRLLRARSFVIYLDAPADLLQKRIANSDRPSLTGSPIVDEVEIVLKRRAELYAQVAHRTVNAALPLDQQLQLTAQTGG